MRFEMLYDRGSDSPDLTPDDFFMRHGTPAAKWVAQDLEAGSLDRAAALLATRARAYSTAHGAFVEAAKRNDDCLRHEPFVISEYDSRTGDVSYLFVFKCENNGNTYRVRYTPDFEDEQP
jgi:hypothetical protein